MKKQFLTLCVVALAMLAAPLMREASAQQPSLSGGGSATQGNKPPRFFGLHFDYSLYSSTGLNATNYNFSFDNYFLPTWNFGQLWFRGTRFSRLALAGRWIVSRNVAGYDDTQFTGQSDGVLTPCANLSPNANGTLDISNESVPRCQYDAQRRTADWNDIWLTLRSPAIYTIPKLDIVISPSFRVVIPTSIQSRLATLQSAITPSVGLSRSFLKGKITLAYGFGFTKFFQKNTTQGFGQYNSSDVNTPLPHNIGYGTADVDRTSAEFYVDRVGFGRNGTGFYNNDYALLNTFNVGISPTDKLSISALYILSDAYTYRTPCDANYGGYTINTCQTGGDVAASSGSRIDEVGHRDFHVLWIAVDYQLLDWLGLTLAWVNVSPRRKPDGTIRQPFFSADYNAFSTVSLGINISIDSAIAKIQEAVEKKKQASRRVPAPQLGATNFALSNPVSSSVQSQ